MPIDDRMKKLDEMNAIAELGGGKERVEEQHRKGKLTARERIMMLLDTGTFQELDKFVTHRSSDFGLEKSRPLGDGVVTGYGQINGRLAYVYAHDFTAFGGSLGEALVRKIVKVMDLALKNGAPVVGINDSGGARIQEGVMSLAAVSEIFFRNTLASGVIPQVSAILGPCAGAAVYSPAMMDFVLIVKGIGNMFVTGPDVVKAALAEEVTFEDLGGAMVHATESGVAHFMTENEQDCLSLIRRLLAYLPSNNSELPPFVRTEEAPDRRDEDLREIIPDDLYKAYDMREIIRKVADNGEYLEVHAGWAQNITVGFGRIAGESVGLVANQPLHLSGSLDVDSSNKASRFIRFCDAFNIPIVTFVDVPGYLPGMDQEHQGLIRHGCKLLYAYCEATVPKVTVITRKAYGGAYCAMGSKYSKADINYAWPTAEIAVMGPEGAINIIFRKEMEGATDAKGTRDKLVKEYREKFANPYIAASRGVIDEVIDPAMTRQMLVAALSSLKNKKEFRPPKKHGNIQL
ncbi:MAG: acyl-CoA carboxylase subunit beta [Thaumarchaeota archaeon]|nr:acyl-CoA carboxylase subunit beta [Nitrososphaerota archaeon]